MACLWKASSCQLVVPGKGYDWARTRNNIWNENGAGFSRAAWIPSGASVDSWASPASCPHQSCTLGEQSGHTVRPSWWNSTDIWERHMQEGGSGPQWGGGLALGQSFPEMDGAQWGTSCLQTAQVWGLPGRDMWGGNRVGMEIKLLKIPFKLWSPHLTTANFSWRNWGPKRKRSLT